MNYSSLTLQYFETAPGAGVLSGPGVYRGAAGGRAQGTWVQFDVQVDAGTLQAARFLAFGCPHTIAVSAWVAEQAAGHEVRASLPESVQSLSERFEVPVEKRGRLLIIEDAWHAALAAALQRPLSSSPADPMV
ncbi:MAG TPA: iron-sulfur cluster assembly scaffold protein [Steroidobacteraceae bacterium]|jgi:NifU-like protein involved in Fe-S cluster formation|nr:iron-sulfur cluster assembly scaffold protein [Steroidobacteraceae bacterium]